MNWKKAESGWVSRTPAGTDLCITETPFGWASLIRSMVLCNADSMEQAKRDAEEMAKILDDHQQVKNDAAEEAIRARYRETI